MGAWTVSSGAGARLIRRSQSTYVVALPAVSGGPFPGSSGALVGIGVFFA